MQKLLSVGALACGIAFVPEAQAGEDLLDIVSAKPCSSIAGDRISASGNCAASNTSKDLAVNLVASSGAIEFKLPPDVVRPDGTSGKPTNVSVDGLMLYNGALAPEVWRLNAGDVLKVKLTNKLPSGDDGATNLHTHGLLVSPDLDKVGGKAAEPVGDTVYVCTVPEGEPSGGPSSKHCALHHSLFGAKPSEMNYEMALPSDHPEGLFWYHPHLHMSARRQVGSGLAGLIYIKGRDTKVSGGARTVDGAEPPERFLMLKDIQVGGFDATDPDNIKASFLPLSQHDSGICGVRTGATPPWPGACFGKDVGWLFTVNGQILPTIKVAAGTTEVWRIGNTSADMTYDLALVEDGTGRPLRLQVLARDGVAATVTGRSDPLYAERILLMPGSRIEVGVARRTADGLLGDATPLAARLRSYGFFTGGGPGFGDAWPAVDLALVEFGAAASPAIGGTVSRSMLKVDRARFVRAQSSAPPGPAPLVVSPWVAAANAGKALAPSRTGIGRASPATHDMMGHGAVGGSSGSDIADASNEDCKAFAPGEERVLALAIKKPQGKPEDFEIGAIRWLSNGSEPWSAAVARALQDAHSFGDRSALLCGHAGHSEIWTIVNPPKKRADGSFDPEGNNETHNFHIHQMKFEVLDVTDPTGRISPPLGGADAGRRVDSFPVPIGGTLRIKVTYKKDQVGGRFVFHCHILEHEDKGMMAEIEVKPN